VNLEVQVVVEVDRLLRKGRITANLRRQVVVDGTDLLEVDQVDLDRTVVLRLVILCTVDLVDLADPLLLLLTTNILTILTKVITIHGLMDILTAVRLHRLIIIVAVVDLLHLRRCTVAVVLLHRIWTDTAVREGIQDHVDHHLRRPT